MRGRVPFRYSNRFPHRFHCFYTPYQSQFDANVAHDVAGAQHLADRDRVGAVGGQHVQHTGRNAGAQCQFVEIDGLDEEIVNELRNRARNVLLTEAIVTEEQLDGVADDLLSLEGMTRELAAKLAGKGVKNRDDLAELAVDELVEMTGIDDERAKEIILKARAHWFE